MKKEIVIEFERIRVIYNRRQQQQRRRRPVWCAFCRREVELLTLEEASEIVGKNERAISEFINCGKLHVNQNSVGETFICFVSLLDAENY